jgi:transcriptional regulator with XRE-family HTH domain
MSLTTERRAEKLDEQTIGGLLRETRLEYGEGRSLNGFAREIGIDPSYISNVERDKVKPSVRLLEEYITKFGLARLYTYEKAGLIKTNLVGDSYALFEDWVNKGNIMLSVE